MSQKRRNIAQRFALMRVFPSCVLVSSLYRIAFAYSRCLSSAAQWINKVNAWVGWCLVGRLEGAWCGGRGVVRCGRLTVGFLGPTYLITHSFAVVIAVSFHKTNLAQRAIARGRTGGALAMSYAVHRHTHLGLLAVYN